MILIQTLIHKLEEGTGRRWLNYLALAVVLLGVGVCYDMRCYRGFNSPEAMDMAQVARNVSEGNGFTTEFIRPFSIYLLKQHNPTALTGPADTTLADNGRVYGPHPDLANPPLYPLVLAGLMKLHTPDWKVETHKPFWSVDSHFYRYPPEFFIAIFNQLLLLAVAWLTFLLAKTIFDARVAWLAAGLTLFSDELWKFSVSGLSTLLLLVIFLGLVWCLAAFELQARAENPSPRRAMLLAASAGLLAGLGLLTRYSFGWVIVPVLVYFLMFGGVRRLFLAGAAGLVFILAALPWIARNWMLSGTPFGVAGYALLEDLPAVFPGDSLMQSLTPEMPPTMFGFYLSFYKFHTNLGDLLQHDLLRLGGGWLGILFLAGLLLGLRNVMARRLRYFTMICLAVFLVVMALGRTELSTLTPDLNTENLLVLLTPLVAIFGVVFFLTLLDQMNTPARAVRYGVIGLVVLLACQPFIQTLLPPKIVPVAYPPYYPPEIQTFSPWIRTNELVMSDVPWAVAWYGDRKCTWTTLDDNAEFFKFNDNVKHVDALFLTLLTLDNKLCTDCLRGKPDSWGRFAMNFAVEEKLPPDFTLKAIPPPGKFFDLFLTDHPRFVPGDQ